MASEQTCTAKVCATCGGPFSLAKHGVMLIDFESDYEHPYVPRPCGAALVYARWGQDSLQGVMGAHGIVKGCERGHTAAEAVR